MATTVQGRPLVHFLYTGDGSDPDGLLTLTQWMSLLPVLSVSAVKVYKLWPLNAPKQPTDVCFSPSERPSYAPPPPPAPTTVSVLVSLFQLSGHCPPIYLFIAFMVPLAVEELRHHSLLLSTIIPLTYGFGQNVYMPHTRL